MERRAWIRVRAGAAGDFPNGFRPTQRRRLSERLEGRSRPGHFARRDRGDEAAANCAAELCLLRAKGCSAVSADHADGARFESGYGNCGLSAGARARRAGTFLKNVYLNQEERKAATVFVSRSGAAKSELAAGVRDVLQLQTILQRTLGAERHARVDYAEIVDAESFEPVVRVNNLAYVVLAVFIGKTR